MTKRTKQTRKLLPTIKTLQVICIDHSNVRITDGEPDDPPTLTLNVHAKELAGPVSVVLEPGWVRYIAYTIDQTKVFWVQDGPVIVEDAETTDDAEIDG